MKRAMAAAAALLTCLVAQPSARCRRQIRRRSPTPTSTKWMTELSNWGRWGKDDQIGTLNLITPDKRKAGAEARA